MDPSSCPAPDLASVLQTLARFAPPPPPAPPAPPAPSTELSVHDEDYEPPETVARAPDHAHLQVPVSAPSSSTTSAISPEVSIPPSKRIDPATITDWPSGLRYVMRTVARNETSIARIKRVSVNKTVHTISENLKAQHFNWDFLDDGD